MIREETYPMSTLIPMTAAGAGKPRRRSARRWLLIVLAALIGVPAAGLVAASLIYSPTYVLRLVRWGPSDVYDYQKFPSRAVQASDNPYYFKEGLDEARIRDLFARAGRDDLDTFLAQTGTQAFLVIQDDTILYERYFNGAQRDSIGSRLVGSRRSRR